MRKLFFLLLVILLVGCSSAPIEQTSQPVIVQNQIIHPSIAAKITDTPSATFIPESTATNWPTPTMTTYPTMTPSPTLGIGSTVISPVDGMVMVYVPAGDFLMGSTDDRLADLYPQHTRYLDAYWIDSTEVTNAMFLQFVSDTGYVTLAEKEGKGWFIDGSNYGWVDGVNWRHPTGPNSNLIDIENHPVIYVSWNDASAYCAWARRRLPTNVEWEKAARGIDGRTHPWGEGIDCSMANIAECSVTGTSAVGSYPTDVSPYGVFDMAGNITEYVLDMYEGYYDVTNGSDIIPTSDGIHVDSRGGSYFDILHIDTLYIELVGVYESYVEGAVPMAGFRCAFSP